jgi:1-acyl-sn-glycerol-3-phosphate acyltransferase
MTDRSYSANPVWAAYEYVAMALGLGVLAALCLFWLPFALVLNLLLPRRIGQPLGRLAIMLGFRIYLGFLALACACRFDLSALDPLGDEGPLILVANHPSLLDAVMIVSRLPNAVCVMKAAIMDNLLFGAAARLSRYIRNDAPLKTIVDAREELRRGAQLVIFPEGTRTRNFPLEPCQPTVGLIARSSGMPVQILVIEFSSPYLGKAWPLFRRPQLPLAFRIRLGERLAPPGNVATFTAELDGHLRRELAASGRSTAK